jgi:HD domain
MTTAAPPPDLTSLPSTPSTPDSLGVITLRARYRLRQALWSLAGAPAADDRVLAEGLLAPQLRSLFFRLSPPEQSHAVRVLQRLQQDGCRQPELLTAALLHDVGKTLYPLNLWERAAIILGHALVPGWAARAGEGQPHGWRRAFVVARHHPAWGATLAAEAGADSTVCALIRHHQDGADPTPPLEGLAELQTADRES